MKIVALGELVECLDRFRIPVTESERMPGNIPYYGANGQQGWIDRAIFDEPLVIVAEDGGHFDNPSRGVAYRIDGPAWVNNHGHVLRATEHLDTNYLYRSLQNYNLAPYISGSTRSKLTQKQLLAVRIPFPPLAEQHRIAAILDHADALRAKRRQVLAHLDALSQSTFEAMFGKATVSLTLSDVAQVQGGLQVTTKRSDLPVEVPYLRVANVMRGHMDLSKVKTIRLTAGELERTRLREGDLLFVEGHGNPNEVGRAAMWDGSIADCTHQNHLIRARFDASKCVPTFASAWVNSRRGARHFRQAGRTTSGLNTISASTVKSAPFIEVALDRQREFATRLEAVDAQCAAVQRALAADDELFASLQAGAFRGDL